MSYITDITLIDIYEKDFDRLNAWLMENDLRHGPGRGQSFRWIDMDGAGGGKVYCSKVAAGAFNHVPHNLLDVLKDGSLWISTGFWTWRSEGGYNVAGVVGWGEGEGLRTVQWVEEVDR